MRIKIACWSPLLGFLVTLLVSGCADKDIASDSDKRGGFYGGISAGGTRP